jgi:hypothetical protein
MSNRLTDERYLLALRRIRQIIADGCPLSFCDSDTPGDKSNECSWGFCSDLSSHWPDAEDHIWPDQFKESGRVSPLYRQDHQFCPMDRRLLTKQCDGNGCFWSCRIFNRMRDPQITREQALALFDQAIQTIESRLTSN